MAWWRAGGAAVGRLGEGGREEGGVWPSGPAQPAGPEERKEKIEIYFKSDF
jgi:hypothetical protein